jgi:hypothetical protein
MGLRLTAPASQIIDTTDAKLYLRIDGNAENALIDSLVLAATRMIEEKTNQRLGAQTWVQTLDSVPGPSGGPWWDGVREGTEQALLGGFASVINLDVSPVNSIASVKVYSLDNSESVVSSTIYRLDNSSYRPRVLLNEGQTWPSGLRNYDAIHVEMNAGYTTIPTDLLQAVRCQLAYMYENRGDMPTELSPLAESLIASRHNWRLC